MKVHVMGWSGIYILTPDIIMGQLDQFSHVTANPFLFVIYKLDYMGVLSFYVLLDALSFHWKHEVKAGNLVVIPMR